MPWLDVSMAAPGLAVSILNPGQARWAAPSHCTACKAAGYATSKAATPATAIHISTWSPAITQRGAQPTPDAALAGGGDGARLPGRGWPETKMMATTKAP